MSLRTRIEALATAIGDAIQETREGPSPTFSLIIPGHYYYLPVTGGPNATGTPTADQLRVCPFSVSKPISLAQISIAVTTLGSGSNIRIGLYQDNNADGIPEALIADYGQVSSATAGNKTWTPGSPVALTPRKVYGVGMVPQGGTMPVLRERNSSSLLTPVSFGTTPAGANMISAWTVAGVSGALPATFTPTGLVQGPAVGLRFS